MDKEMAEEALASMNTRADAGMEKILRDLLDRGYKMHVMAGTTTRLSEQNADQNDPLLAWLSDVRSVLYGRTKPVPNVNHFAGTEVKAHISEVPLDDSAFRPSLANIHDCDCNTSPHKSGCAIHRNRSRK